MADKAPDAFLTIGEMAKRVCVKTHILRYWEEQFPMLRPLTRAGGRRLYRPSDVALVEQIQDLLARQGYTIRGARAYLSGRGSADELSSTPPAPSASSPTFLGSTTEDDPVVLAELQRLRARLAAALAAN